MSRALLYFAEFSFIIIVSPIAHHVKEFPAKSAANSLYGKAGDSIGISFYFKRTSLQESGKAYSCEGKKLLRPA